MIWIIVGFIVYILITPAPTFWDALLKVLGLKSLRGRCYGDYGGSNKPVACEHIYFRGRN